MFRSLPAAARALARLSLVCGLLACALLPSPRALGQAGPGKPDEVDPRSRGAAPWSLGPGESPIRAPAAPGDADGAKKPVVMTPPKLKKFVEATYPTEAYTQGIGGTVELEVVIGVDGKVIDARVVMPAGHGFDEAALAAVRQFEFEPATRDGQPMKAKARYPYVFELKQEAVPEAPPPEEVVPETSRFEGRVLAIENDEALANVEILVMPEGSDEARRATTDKEGRFLFAELTPGTYMVRVQLLGREPREQKEFIRSELATTVTYRLQEPPDPEAFGAVARIQPPPREVTRRTISKEQLTRIPGTRGDALRTVELMPGVARPPLGSGVLIVRGSAPSDTQALFEGIPIPLLYHFGGLTSFINSRFIESIDFYPGNFSVRYGRRRGGIIEVGAADLPREAFHGVADINLVDASLLAVRRSYFDVLLEGALEDADVSTTAAPVYYDYQAMAVVRPSVKDELRLMAYGSSDRFALLFDEASDQDSAVSGDFDFGTQFHHAHLGWRRQLSPKVDQDIDLSIGYLDVDFGLGDAFDFNLTGTEIYQRSEWRGRVTDEVRLIGGLDLFFMPGQFLYSGPPVEQTEGNAGSMGSGASVSNRDFITATDEFLLAQPAVYLETDINLAPVRFLLGSRIDYFEEIDSFTYDPRASVHVTLSESTTVKGGVGLFAQPPQFQESSPELGNPELGPSHTLHAGIGAEQELAEGVTIGLDGFYKHLYDNTVGTPTGEAPFFTNDGEGRIYGGELHVKVNPRGRFFAYLSYTLSRSERNDRGEGWRLFDFDQPHILTASAVYRLGRGWEVGGTFRLVSGNPDTPIVGSSLNAISGLYSPRFGELNSARNPTFHRLDLRVEKQWTFDAWKLALYLDLQNAYNRANPEGTIYDFEYREKQEITGLPILPILGLRGEI
jgi:TonB family protein